MKVLRSGSVQSLVPVLLWMVFIFILSSVPGQDIPDLSVPYFHRVVHLFEYSILGGLCIRFFLRVAFGKVYFTAAMLGWIVTAIFAISDEWHQTFVPGRSGRLEDVLFDAFCAVLGILGYLYPWRHFNRRGRIFGQPAT